MPAANRVYLAAVLCTSAQIRLRQTSDMLGTLYDIPPLRRWEILKSRQHINYCGCKNGNNR